MSSSSGSETTIGIANSAIEGQKEALVASMSATACRSLSSQVIPSWKQRLWPWCYCHFSKRSSWHSMQVGGWTLQAIVVWVRAGEKTCAGRIFSRFKRQHHHLWRHFSSVGSFLIPEEDWDVRQRVTFPYCIYTRMPKYSVRSFLATSYLHTNFSQQKNMIVVGGEQYPYMPVEGGACVR